MRTIRVLGMTEYRRCEEDEAEQPLEQIVPTKKAGRSQWQNRTARHQGGGGVAKRTFRVG